MKNKNNRQIIFTLPVKENAPVGGFKIIYSYADLFSQDGYEVHLLYPETRIDYFNTEHNFFLKIKRFFGFYYRRARHQYHPGNWFSFKYPVRLDFVFQITQGLSKKYSFDALYFATSVETAYELNRVKSIPPWNKFYLIQDFENWKGHTDEYVYKSYTFPFRKIVISQWLRERVQSAGEDAVVIPNGLDFTYFTLSIPIESRNPHEIAMLYHKDDRKRCADAIAALEQVHHLDPLVHVTAFGTPEKPDDLPDWFSYVRCPDRERHNLIYNTAAIFVAASMKEGWALPPAESMQCGCALVCTDIGGFSDYAYNGKTALISPVKDINALASNIKRLIDDNNLRISIAKEGYKNIQQFTWKNSFAMMIAFVEKDK